MVSVALTVEQALDEESRGIETAVPQLITGAARNRSVCHRALTWPVAVRTFTRAGALDAVSEFRPRRIDLFPVGVDTTPARAEEVPRIGPVSAGNSHTVGW